MVVFQSVENVTAPISWQILLKQHPMHTPERFILYGTAACHLCEQAVEMLSAADTYLFELEKIDISINDLLLERYGTRIPVLRHVPSGQELDWPFDPNELDRFLRSIC